MALDTPEIQEAPKRRNFLKDLLRKILDSRLLREKEQTEKLQEEIREKMKESPEKGAERQKSLERFKKPGEKDRIAKATTAASTAFLNLPGSTTIDDENRKYFKARLIGAYDLDHRGEDKVSFNDKLAAIVVKKEGGSVKNVEEELNKKKREEVFKAFVNGEISEIKLNGSGGFAMATILNGGEKDWERAEYVIDNLVTDDITKKDKEALKKMIELRREKAKQQKEKKEPSRTETESEKKQRTEKEKKDDEAFSKKFEEAFKLVEDAIKEEKPIIHADGVTKSRSIVETTLDTKDLLATEQEIVDVRVLDRYKKEKKNGQYGREGGISKIQYEDVLIGDPSKRSIRSRLFEKNLDKIIDRHNEGKKWYGTDSDGKTILDLHAEAEIRKTEAMLDRVADPSKEIEEDAIMSKLEKQVQQRNERLVKLVNLALGKGPSDPNILEIPPIGQHTNAEGHLNKNIVKQVQGGVAIVSSNAEQFADLVLPEDTDPETRRQYIEALKRGTHAGAFLKGDIAERINEGIGINGEKVKDEDGEIEGYKGGVMLIYAKDYYDGDSPTKEQEVQRQTTLDLINHEVEHLIQKETRETVEDIASPIDDLIAIPEFADKSIQEILTEVGEGPEVVKEILGEDIEEFPILAVVRDFFVQESDPQKRKDFLEKIERVYYSSKGLKPGEAKSMWSFAENVLGIKKERSLDVFQAVWDNGEKFPNYYDSDTEESIDNHPLLGVIAKKKISAAEADMIYSDFSSVDKLSDIQKKVESVVGDGPEKKYKTIDEMFYRIAKGELVPAELEGISLFEKSLYSPNKLDHLEAKKIFKSFIEDKQERETLFEFSGMVAQGALGLIGEGTRDGMPNIPEALNDIYEKAKKDFGWETTHSEFHTLKRTWPVKLRRLYLEPLMKKGEDGVIPLEHRNILKMWIAADLAVIKADGDPTQEEAIRMELLGAIMNNHHKGTEHIYKNFTDFYLGHELTKTIDEQVENYIKANEKTPDELIRNLYGEEEDFPIPKNKDIDFGSVFAFNRDLSEIFGAKADNPEGVSDMRDVWNIMGSWASQPDDKDAIGFLKNEKILKDDGSWSFEGKLNSNDPNVRAEAKREKHIAERAMARSRRGHPGIEMAGNPSLLGWLAEVSPLGAIHPMNRIKYNKMVGSNSIPDFIKYAWGTDPRASHSQGRDWWGEFPGISTVLKLSYPSLVKRGLIVPGMKERLLPKIEPPEFMSETPTTEDFLRAINGGLQNGLGALGLNTQELFGFLDQLPGWELVQTSRYAPPQIEPSLNRLDQDKYQIWHMEKEFNAKDDPKGGKGDKLNLHKEMVWVNGTEEELRAKIAEAQAKLDAIPTLSIERYGKVATALENDISKYKGDIEMGKKMEGIYNSLNSKNDIFDMRDLFLAAKRAHEGDFWDGKEMVPGEYYFQVPVWNPDKQIYEKYELKDVHEFIRRYYRANVYKIMVDREFDVYVPEKTELQELEGHFEQYHRGQKGLENDIEKYKGLLNKAIEENADQLIIDDYRSKIEQSEQEKGAIDEKTTELQERIDALKKKIEIKEKFRMPNYPELVAADHEGLVKGGTPEVDKMFGIVWGEADGYIENIQKGFHYFAEFQRHLLTAQVLQRNAHYAGKMYEAFDRFFNHAGHYMIIGGLVGALAVGAPFWANFGMLGFGAVVLNGFTMNRSMQLWKARKGKAAEVADQLKQMEGFYNELKSGKLVTPEQVRDLHPMFKKTESWVEGILEVQAEGRVKFPADRAALAVGGGILNFIAQNALGSK